MDQAFYFFASFISDSSLFFLIQVSIYILYFLFHFGLGSFWCVPCGVVDYFCGWLFTCLSLVSLLLFLIFCFCFLCFLTHIRISRVFRVCCCIVPTVLQWFELLLLRLMLLCLYLLSLISICSLYIYIQVMLLLFSMPHMVIVHFLCVFCGLWSCKK